MDIKDPASYIFSTEIKVRDYELDAEGIVNNANYLHYLEYTRHEFCLANGCSFAKMTEEGIIPVMRRAEIDYINSLRSLDVMVSILNLERRGPRFLFHQQIYRKSDNAPVLDAYITIVSIENGRPSRGDRLAEMFSKYI